MNVSVFEVSARQFVLTLRNIKNLLEKANIHAGPDSKLLQTQIFPDMFDLGREIQASCDAAKFCGSRLTQLTGPVFEEKIENYEELQIRLDKTINYLLSLKSEDFKDFEKRKIKFPWNPGKELSGKDYLIQFALPNFYYHITSAYNIIRSTGVELGKADFLGQINWQQEN